MKSEPDTFSIDALEAKPNGTDAWEGVRNPVARNMMQVRGSGRPAGRVAAASALGVQPAGLGCASALMEGSYTCQCLFSEPYVTAQRRSCLLLI